MGNRASGPTTPNPPKLPPPPTYRINIRPKAPLGWMDLFFFSSLPFLVLALHERACGSCNIIVGDQKRLMWFERDAKPFLGLKPGIGQPPEMRVRQITHIPNQRAPQNPWEQQVNGCSHLSSLICLLLAHTFPMSTVPPLTKRAKTSIASFLLQPVN